MSTDTAAEQPKQQHSIGKQLRQAREALDFSEKEVADRLRITVHYVSALETDQFKKLPGSVFVIGYLKSYANLLGIDGEPLVQRYREWANEREPVSETEMQRRVSWRKHDNRPHVTMSLTLFVGLFVALWIFRGAGGDVETVDNDVAVNTNTVVAGPVGAGDGPALLPSLSSAASGPAAGATERSGSDSGSPLDDATIEPEDTLPQFAGQGTFEAEVPQRAIRDQQPSEPSREAAVDPVQDAMPVSARGEQEESRIVETSAPDKSTETAGLAGVAGSDNDPHLIEIHTEGSDRLRINFSGESWVEIVDGSAQQIYRDLREAGDVLEVTGHGPFNVLLGHAPRTRLEFNGDEVDVSDDVRIDNTARLTVGL